MGEEKKGFWSRLVSGLSKTRDNIVSGIDAVFNGFSNIDDDFYEELEEILIMSDIGVNTTMEIIEKLKEQVKELKEFQEAKTIFCYASMKNEVDTWQLIASALKQGKNVGVPLCIGKGIMEVRQIHALDDFEEGAYGIMEPSRRCPILSKE